MSCKMLGLSLMVLMAIVIGASGQECGTCMVDNEAKCLDEKTYVFCMSGIAGTIEMKCEGDKVCTNSENICEELPLHDPSIINVCDKSATGKCGVCPPATSKYHRYTCVTQTAFSRCVRGTPIAHQESCLDGKLFSNELYEALNRICAAKATLDDLELNITCEAPAPPNPQETARECMQAELEWEGPLPSFFQILAKKNPCKEYIFCERIRGIMFGTHIICPNYYNVETERCVTYKPRICPDPPMSATTEQSTVSTATQSTHTDSTHTDTTGIATTTTDSTHTTTTDSTTADGTTTTEWQVV